METVWQNGTVSDCASICLQSFNQCLAHFDLLGPREQAAVEDQLGRFSIWASNIGVFAPTRGSLDYRLRDAADIQRLVRRLLHTLNDHVQRYLSHLAPLGLQDGPPLEMQTSVTDALDSITADMAEEISLMHQLSNTIRKASREVQNLKAAAAFKIKDEDGNDMGQTFMDLFARGIIQRKFPDCNETLQKRLAAAMLLRRKRILYRRSRYGKSSLRPPRTLDKVVPNADMADIGTEREKPPLVQQRPAPSTSHARSTAGSQALTATTLNIEQWKKASTPSVMSRSKTIHWTGREQLDFPPAPLGPVHRRLQALKEQRLAAHADRVRSLLFCDDQVDVSEQQQEISDLEADLNRKIASDRVACNNGNMEVICPYCCCALSSSIVTNNLKWMDHVKYDLDPYVCLFDTCDTPDELYNHSEDWLNHMRQHNLRWRCAAKSHGIMVFQTKTEYEAHMSTKHKSTKSQLTILADRSSRRSGPLFQACPLCGKSESIGAGLEEHVASHLRYLALKSLPFPEDQTEDHGSEIASGVETSDCPTRSTVMLEDVDIAQLALDQAALDEPSPVQLQFEEGRLERSSIALASLAQMVQGDKGVQVMDRRWHLRLHYNSFVGSALTTWLLHNFRDIDTREEAVEFGQLLMDQGLFQHVEKKHDFRDGNYFYQISGEYCIARPESGGGWFPQTQADKSVPSTSAIEETTIHDEPLPTGDIEQMAHPTTTSNTTEWDFLNRPLPQRTSLEITLSSHQGDKAKFRAVIDKTLNENVILRECWEHIRQWQPETRAVHPLVLRDSHKVSYNVLQEVFLGMRNPLGTWSDDDWFYVSEMESAGAGGYDVILGRKWKGRFKMSTSGHEQELDPILSAFQLSMRSQNNEPPQSSSANSRGDAPLDGIKRLASPIDPSTSPTNRGRGRCPHPDCGRVFRDLEAHMLTHQSERPEKCPIVSCEYHTKGFARRYDRVRHTLTHFKGLMVCIFCPGAGMPSEKTFNRVDVFKRHLTLLHGVEQTPPSGRTKTQTAYKGLLSAAAPCSVCNRMFNHPQDFYDHLEDCVLTVVAQEEPSEAINQRNLQEVASDNDFQETLQKHILQGTNDENFHEFKIVLPTPEQFERLGKHS